MKSKKRSKILVLVIGTVVAFATMGVFLRVIYLGSREIKGKVGNVVAVVELTVALKDKKSGHEEGRYIIPVTVTEYPRPVTFAGNIEMEKRDALMKSLLKRRLIIKTNDESSTEAEIVKTEITWKRPRVLRFFENVWDWLRASLS